MNSPPRRIVSLAASNTETVCALGLGDRLVGLDDFSDYPPQVQHLPRVGRDLDIDVNRVVELRPDLVLASLSVPGMERNLPKLQARDLPFVVIPSSGWNGLWAAIREVGRVCGADERAEELVGALQARARLIAERVGQPDRRPRVYWEWWPRPTITAGGPSWITQMVQLAGGTSCFGDRDRESLTVDLADLRERDPEVIVLCWCGARKLPDPRVVGGRPGWNELSAVRTGRVHAVLEPCFGRPGPRLVDGLESLAPMLHPDNLT